METRAVRNWVVLVLAIACPWMFSHPTVVLAEAPGDEQSAEADEYVVTGRVADAAGRGIAGATVEWGNNYTPFQGRQRVTTDANGFYSMTLKSLNGRNRLAASAPEYSPDVGYSRITPGRMVRNFVLIRTPKEGHTAAGTVVDDQGKPIAGVRVEAFTPVTGFYSSFSMPTGRDYFPGPDRVAKTDEKGHFRITDLPSGEVQLSLQSKHRHVNDDNYPIQEDLKIKMSGPGKRGVVQAQIVDEDSGLPPADADQIRIVPRYSPTDNKRANDEGRFRTTSKASLGGNYLVYIYAKGYAATDARLTALSPGSKEYTKILLKKSPPLQGKLIDDETGKPIAGAKLLYGIADNNHYIEWSTLDKYADGHHSLSFVQHVLTGPDGEFWFAEPQGKSKGTIIVFVGGYQRLMLDPAARLIDNATGDLVVRVKRESAFTGVVLQHGKPLANVGVSVGGPSSAGNFHHMYESVRTDAEGKYKFGRLLPGRYHVNGGRWSRVADVGEGETKSLNLGGDLGSIRIHGQADPSITINIRPEFDWDYRGFSTEVNAAGEYEFNGLKPGKYRVTLHYAYPTGYIDHEEVEIEVDHDGQQFDFRHGPNGKVIVKPAIGGK